MEVSDGGKRWFCNISRVFGKNLILSEVLRYGSWALNIIPFWLCKLSEMHPWPEEKSLVKHTGILYHRPQVAVHHCCRGDLLRGRS